MSTFPPRNINPLKPSQMPNTSWAIIPFIWEIAGLQRHPSWTFNAFELPPNWPMWVLQYKEYFDSKHIDIRDQLEKIENPASIPHITQMELLQPLNGKGQPGHELNQWINKCMNPIWFPQKDQPTTIPTPPRPAVTQTRPPSEHSPPHVVRLGRYDLSTHMEVTRRQHLLHPTTHLIFPAP